MNTIIDAGGKPSLESTEKFALLVDLGTITVPGDYDHATALESFRERNRSKFLHYSDDLTDQNFPNPTRVLKPGDRFRVRVFGQVVDHLTTTSEERMAFLATQGAVHVDAQGASLVFEQKGDLLPKNKWCASFDGERRLWANASGDHGVPRVFRGTDDGDFRFRLGAFEVVWDGDDALLCFCDVE